MKHIILMSHGKLASGLLSALEIITGAQDNIYAIDMYVDNKKLTEKVQELVNEHNIDLNQTMIITDIMGGSVNQEVTRMVDLDQTMIIAGMNLPMLLTLVTSNLSTYSVEDAKKLVASTHEQIVFVNELLADDSDDF